MANVHVQVTDNFGKRREAYDRKATINIPERMPDEMRLVCGRELFSAMHAVRTEGNHLHNWQFTVRLTTI